MIVAIFEALPFSYASYLRALVLNLTVYYQDS